MDIENVRKNDLEIVKEWLEENKDELKYDEDKEVWLIGNEEIVDELYFEPMTMLHPKELINDIENMIEKGEIL